MDNGLPDPGPLPDDWWRHHFDPNSPELAPRMYETLAPCGSGARWRTVTCTTASGSSRGMRTSWGSRRTGRRSARPTACRFRPRRSRAVAAYERPTRELVNRLIDNFIETGSCEFMDEFARPFPSRMFFEMVISAPPEDIDRVAYMASKASLPNDPEAGECWLGLSEWIRDFIAERRRRPQRSDVIDAVIGATVDGRPVTDDEIIGIVQLIILGGLETTASALGLWFHRFCGQPEIPALLRAAPERIPEAIEELLRIDSPFVSIVRTAVRDGKIGDQEIRGGDKVVMYWASANRDAAEFATPDDFRLDRERNRHLAFGVGPHRCAGSNLARLNLRIGLEESLRRLHDIRLRDGAGIHFHSTSTRSPLTLPITFTPGRRLAASGA
jgi:cytochrome P450